MDATGRELQLSRPAGRRALGHGYHLPFQQQPIEEHSRNGADLGSDWCSLGSVPADRRAATAGGHSRSGAILSHPIQPSHPAVGTGRASQWRSCTTATRVSHACACRGRRPAPPFKDNTRRPGREPKIVATAWRPHSFDGRRPLTYSAQPARPTWAIFAGTRESGAAATDEHSLTATARRTS